MSASADEALAKIKGQVLSKGPGGEEPSPASVADLTDEEVAQVKEMGATAAIVMHYGGNDWANAQIAGLKSEFERLGVEVIATTDANFKPDKQVSDLETVMTRDPDVIVSIPTDPVATASAYKEAAEAGAKLVFMDNVPQGLTAGKDYVSVVSADNFGNGVVSAHLMAKALGGKGKIGMIFHEADFFVTQQRYQGFKDTIEAEYPDIEIVEEKGIAGPDFAGDAQGAANAMLSKYADLSGIWAVWDVPAEGVMAAARAAGRTDLKIATEDLGKNVAIALAKNQLIVGLGAQVPFDQGVTEARLAAQALLGKTPPPYVALSAVPVEHDNVLEAWEQVYHEDAPEDVKDSFKK
ncbi:substrate-binding domain-containing protein [Planctomonas deserti]|uniref:substrate-binding domain-containing protein n=1 Tax=Planctomonas deserti TaxID=2144185 RepID=UPI001F0B783E|nr:substrate-binding domain-containing protein [Planctomonas deserti]